MSSVIGSFHSTKNIFLLLLLFESDIGENLNIVQYLDLDAYGDWLLIESPEFKGMLLLSKLGRKNSATSKGSPWIA